MFYNCKSLKNLNISQFKTDGVRNMSRMFCNCSSLIKLVAKKFNINKETDTFFMLKGCKTEIKEIILGEKKLKDVN